MFSFGRRVLFGVIGIVMTASATTADRLLENPKFSEPITNVTVPVGREAILTCLVEDLGAYKVAWLRVDTQTILTIHSHVITKNHRIGVTHSEHRTWYLHIREVRETDRGWYMCQINTDPMKSQIGYLDVVVPPDILDYPTSTDMIVREGSSVSMRCVAKGSPEPSIAWKRELGESIQLQDGSLVPILEGPMLNLTKVTRQEMGAYLCIASNGVPPSVSKRIMLWTHFPPMIWIQNQMVGAYLDQHVVLECHSEAFPKPIIYWTTDKGEIVPDNGKFEKVVIEKNNYKFQMKLSIKSVSASDYGAYKCVAKNALGDTDGTIQLYAIPKPSKRSNGTSKKGKYRKKYNDVTADLSRTGNGEDQADSLYQEDEYFNSAASGQINRGKSLLLIHFSFLAYLVLALPYVLQQQ